MHVAKIQKHQNVVFRILVYWLFLVSGREGNGIKKEYFQQSASVAKKLIFLKRRGGICGYLLDYSFFIIFEISFKKV